MFELFEDIQLPFYGVRLPEFKLEDEDRIKLGLKENCSSLDTLTALCRLGFKEKILSDPEKVKKSQVYVNQIKHELDVLNKTNFTDYIILVYDVMRFCKIKEIPVGIGRGSAASSLVNYLIGITGIDPIEWGLYFERFISVNRAKSTLIDGALYYDGSLLPDIDCDICAERRPEVVEYLKTKNPNRCSKLVTISTLQTKILIKEVGKIVGGFSEEDMNLITDLIESSSGKVHTIDKTIEDSPRFKEFADKNPLVIEIAKKLYEGPKAKGIHASAYLLSYDKLDDFMPTEVDADGELCASFDMRSATSLTLKLDLLGLRCVTIIDKVCKMIGMKVEDIPVHSYDNVYKYIQYLDTPYGLFQISGDSVVKSLNRMAAQSMEELSNVIAIARPGAMHFVDDYVNVTYPVEDVKVQEILKPTRGVCIFQEQTLAIGVKVFGLSPDESESVRRCIGKKKREEMPKWLALIEEKAKELKISKEVKEYYLQVLTDGANYQFSSAHSAPYSYLGALTVFLKFNFPKEFFLVNLEVNGKEDISAIERELPFFGIKLLRPDIVKSSDDFKIEGENIRFGLKGIKSLNDSSLLKIHDFLNKETTSKMSVFNAAKQAKVSILVLANIIHAGALNSLGNDRPRLVLEAQIWNILTDKEKSYCLKNGGKYDYNLIEMLKHYLSWISDDGKKFKESRLETIRRDSVPYIKQYQNNSKYSELYKYVFEKKLLGYCYSTTLKNVFIKDNPRLKNIQEVKDLVDRSPVEIVATVSDLKQGKTKKGDKNYLKLFLSDETGEFAAMILGDKLDNYLTKNAAPVEGDMVYLKASKGLDILWINSLSIQGVH